MRYKVVLTLAVLVCLAFLVAFIPVRGVTNFGSVWISDSGGTAQPALKVDQYGAGQIFEALDGGTPVFSIANGGGVTTQNTLNSGALNNVVVSQPTAATTATPAAIINSLAAGGNLLEVQDSSVTVFKIPNGGGVNIAAPTAIATAIPGLAVNNAGVSKPFEFSDSGAVVLDALNGGGVRVIAPTAVATAVPGLSVSNPGVSNALEITAKGTPALVVQANGDIATQNGYVLQYPSADIQMICGSETVADTANVLHGLTTPYFAICSLNQTITGDASLCSAEVAASTITVKVRNGAATPVANTTPAAVNWCAVGVK